MTFHAWYRRIHSAIATSVTYRYIPAILLLALGGGLSLLASAIVWRWERESLQVDFQRRRDNLATTLQQKIDEYLQTTRSLGAFYDAAPGGLTRASLKEFSQLFFSRYPGIFSMGFTKRVSAEEREAYEQWMRSEGFPNFTITEKGVKKKFVPAGDRPEYFAVTYIEPFPKRKPVVGYDVSVEPERKAALEKARDTGKMVATERVALANVGEAGFLLYRPVYRQNSPLSTVSDRRAAFEGHVFSVFAISEVIKYSLQGLQINNIDFYLYDNSAEKAENRFLIYYDSSEQAIVEDAKRQKAIDRSASRLLCPNLAACTYNFNIADREWSLLFVPTAAYTGLQIYWRAGSTLIIGLLLTGSLAAYLVISLRYTNQIEELVQERTEQATQLSQALNELKQTQVQLIQSEKMSSLGQLVAGIAHEINNPVNFIYGNVNHANSYIQHLLAHVRLYQQEHLQNSVKIEEHAEEIDLDFIGEDLPKILASMRMGAERIREIVLSLRNFSRLDEADMKSVDLHEGIDSSLLILQNRLKAKPGQDRCIEIIKEYGNLPQVECYPGQLNQVFMNILSNAIDALEEKNEEWAIGNGKNAQCPTLRIGTEVIEDERAVIRIADNGPGISEGLRSRIFDPFFTTKPVGKGTGLGLSIAYQIIADRHGGKLECFSAPGEGTEFRIEIPIHQSRKQSVSEKKLTGQA